MKAYINESLKVLAAGFADQKGASYGFGPNAERIRDYYGHNGKHSFRA